MHQLASSNFQNVIVQLRDETITMPATNGTKLMEYLTSDNASSHVMITDTQGTQFVVNKNDIRRISPVKKPSYMKSPQELGMEEDNRTELGEGYEKFKRLRDNLVK